MYRSNYVYYHELRGFAQTPKRRKYRVSVYGNGDAIGIDEWREGEWHDFLWLQGEEAHEYTALYDEKGWRGLSRRLIMEDLIP